MQLISKTNRQTICRSSSRIITPLGSINKKKKRQKGLYLFHENYTGNKQLLLKKQTNQKNQLLKDSDPVILSYSTLEKVVKNQQISYLIYNYLQIQEVKGLQILNKNISNMQSERSRYLISRINELQFSKVKASLLLFCRISLLRQFEFLSSISSKLCDQIQDDTYQVPRISAQNVRIVFLTTKCLRLKYPNLNYNRNLPLIVYNLLLLVGETNIFDIMVILIWKRNILNLFDNGIQNQIVRLIQRKIKNGLSLRLKCIGKYSASSFYEQVVKRLFIGNNPKSWNRFILLLLNQGWIIGIRLIYYLIQQMKMTGNYSQASFQKGMLRLSSETEDEESLFILQMLQIIEPTKKANKSQKPIHSHIPFQKSSSTKGFKVTCRLKE